MSRPCENCGADLRVCKDCIIHDGYVPFSVIEDIKAQIENRMNEIKEVDEKNKTISMKGYVLGLVRALEIIDRKVNEVKGDKE